jgi:hypothetical protein
MRGWGEPISLVSSNEGTAQSAIDHRSLPLHSITRKNEITSKYAEVCRQVAARKSTLLLDVYEALGGGELTAAKACLWDGLHLGKEGSDRLFAGALNGRQACNAWRWATMYAFGGVRRDDSLCFHFQVCKQFCPIFPVFTPKKCLHLGHGMDM